MHIIIRAPASVRKKESVETDKMGEDPEDFGIWLVMPEAKD
jgi:hypothetical protein